LASFKKYTLNICLAKAWLIVNIVGHFETVEQIETRSVFKIHAKNYIFFLWPRRTRINQNHKKLQLNKLRKQLLPTDFKQEKQNQNVPIINQTIIIILLKLQ